MEIYKANKVLILGFKRFFQGRKNRRNIQIPDEIFPSDILMPPKDYQNKYYRLYAAIIHHGGLNGGHYTAVCYNYHEKEWMEYDDSRVYGSSKRDISGEDVYALFYELISQEASEYGSIQSERRSKSRAD